MSGIRMGFGMANQYQLKPWFSLKPQFNYYQKGSRIQNSSGYEDSGYNENKFHYLGLDLLAQFKVAKWQKVQPYFQTGLRVDLLIYSDNDYDLDMLNGSSQFTGFNTVTLRNGKWYRSNYYERGIRRIRLEP